MKRFDYINHFGTVGYTPAEIAGMTDSELAAAIREEPDWNPSLLEDLIWRAYPDYDEPWEVGDQICYDAACALGVTIEQGEDESLRQLDKHEFVRGLFDATREHPEPIDLETAQQDLRNFRAEGWRVPADLTAEEYMEIWNGLCREYET